MRKLTDQCCGSAVFRLNDPWSGAQEQHEEEIERAILKELRMKGFVNGGCEAYQGMDRDMSGDSLIIPARINKDGSLGRSSAATMEQFRV
jgi:ATP-dependent helicase/nuclease subunit B